MRNAVGVYKGPRTHLVGERAMLMGPEEGYFQAQFNNTRATLEVETHGGEPHISTSLGYGWHVFDEADFEVDKPVAFEERDPQDGGPMHAHLLNTGKPENY